MQDQLLFIDYEKKYIRSKSPFKKVRIKSLLAFVNLIPSKDWYTSLQFGLQFELSKYF